MELKGDVSIPTQKKDSDLLSKTWNHNQVKDYLLTISKGAEFLLPINQYPEKIQLSTPWHELLKQIRKESWDKKERYALAGCKNDFRSLYLSEKAAIGNKNDVPIEVISEHFRKAHRSGMIRVAGDIHSHPNWFWHFFNKIIDKEAQAFSTGDLYGLLLSRFNIKFSVLVESARNFFVFRSKETDLIVCDLNQTQKQFEDYWNAKMIVERSAINKGINSSFKKRLGELALSPWDINRAIAEKYKLVIYSGKPNEDLKKEID